MNIIITVVFYSKTSGTKINVAPGLVLTLCYLVQYCAIVIFSAMLCFWVQCCAIWCNVVLSYLLQSCAIWCNVVLFGAIFCGLVQCWLYSATLCYLVQCCTICWKLSSKFGCFLMTYLKQNWNECQSFSSELKTASLNSDIKSQQYKSFISWEKLVSPPWFS